MKLMTCVISSAVMFMAGGIIGQNIKTEQLISVASAATVGTGMTLAQLATKAQSIIPGTITSQKFDYENGVKVAEFDIVTANGIKRKLSLRASDGSVWDIDSEYDDKGNRFIRQDLFKVNTTFEQAQVTALARVPGGTVLATKQDADDGKFIYEFMIKAPNGLIYEVDVETQGGIVVKYEVDDDFNYLKYIDLNNIFRNTANAGNTGVTNTVTTTPQASQVASRHITEAQARQIALEAVPGTVLWVEYDWDDASPEWEYHIRVNGYRKPVEVKVSGWGYIDEIDWD